MSIKQRSLTFFNFPNNTVEDWQRNNYRFFFHILIYFKGTDKYFPLVTFTPKQSNLDCYEYDFTILLS